MTDLFITASVKQYLTLIDENLAEKIISIEINATMQLIGITSEELQMIEDYYNMCDNDLYERV